MLQSAARPHIPATVCFWRQVATSVRWRTLLEYVHDDYWFSFRPFGNVLISFCALVFSSAQLSPAHPWIWDRKADEFLQIRLYFFWRRLRNICNLSLERACFQHWKTCKKVNLVVSPKSQSEETVKSESLRTSKKKAVGYLLTVFILFLLNCSSCFILLFFALFCFFFLTLTFPFDLIRFFFFRLF